VAAAHCSGRRQIHFAKNLIILEPRVSNLYLLPLEVLSYLQLLSW